MRDSYNAWYPEVNPCINKGGGQLQRTIKIRFMNVRKKLNKCHGIASKINPENVKINNKIIFHIYYICITVPLFLLIYKDRLELPHCLHQYNWELHMFQYEWKDHVRTYNYILCLNLTLSRGRGVGGLGGVPPLCGLFLHNFKTVYTRALKFLQFSNFIID